LSGSVAEFGPAEQPYDFIHVDDAVRALVLLGAGEGDVSGSFYIGNGKPKPLKEYLIEIGRLAGRPELIGIGRRPDDGTRYCEEWFDVKRLCRETGFSAAKDFSDGVKEMIAEFERTEYDR
jgi:nucleoside-diphosphate-sugar epimerase